MAKLNPLQTAMIDQLQKQLEYYFPRSEFRCDATFHAESFGYHVQVEHIGSGLRIFQAIADDCVIEFTHLNHFLYAAMETLSMRVHHELASYGESEPCDLRVLSGPAEVPGNCGYPRGLEQAEEILAVIALTGWQLRYRHRHGFNGKDLTHSYYLVKNGVAHDLPPVFLENDVTFWKQYLSNLMSQPQP